MELSCSILRNFFSYIFSKESFSYKLNKFNKTVLNFWAPKKLI